MKKKTFTNICGIVSFLGFMFMYGTVGAMDQDTISLTQGIIQSAIGLTLFGGAAYIGGFMR